MLGAAALALALACGGAKAEEPTPASVAAAKEIIELKGTARMFDPAIPGVIETAKNTLLQTNPQLSKDLNEVAAQLRTEFAGKRAEIFEQMARTYAEHFSEGEIKDVLGFYKSPVGRKVIAEEPQILEQTMSRLSGWAEKFSDEVFSRMRAEMKKRGHTV